MTEMYASIGCNNIPADRQAKILSGEETRHGLSLSANLRFVVVCNPVAGVLLDFQPCTLYAGCIYFVPPCQILYLPCNVADFLLVEMLPELFTPVQQHALYRLYYPIADASLPPNVQHTAALFNFLDNIRAVPVDAKLIMSAVWRILAGTTQLQAVTSISTDSVYYDPVRIFLNRLYSSELNCKGTAMQVWTQQTGIHVQTLRRCCTRILGKTAREIFQWHFRAKLLFLLACRTDMSVSEMAYHTGFSELSSFSRFIKKQTGMPPLAIRQKLADVNY